MKKEIEGDSRIRIPQVQMKKEIEGEKKR